ncbi:NAD(P)-binding protein [Schizophyllum commune Tattone D]|nr:NAD(P)-binding protein [Schizophyllum commune Tattone D]
MPFGTSKVFLVTGSNTGIGFEIVKQLAQAGHTVYLAARSVEAGKKAQEELNKEGLNVKFVHLDVTDAQTIAAAKKTIEEAEGKLDVLINNAGVSFMNKPQSALDVDVETVRATCEVNLFGLIQTCQTFLPLLRKSSQAVILNITTDMASNAYQARPDSSLHVVAYNTSKAAANSYTIALAHELKKEGIKVNAITPGFTTTKLNGFAPGGKTPQQAATDMLPWALLDKDGPTGVFIGPDGKTEFPW